MLHAIAATAHHGMKLSTSAAAHIAHAIQSMGRLRCIDHLLAYAPQRRVIFDRACDGVTKEIDHQLLYPLLRIGEALAKILPMLETCIGVLLARYHPNTEFLRVSRS
jgi:hypothetical protein